LYFTHKIFAIFHTLLILMFINHGTNLLSENESTAQMTYFTHSYILLLTKIMNSISIDIKLQTHKLFFPRISLDVHHTENISNRTCNEETTGKTET
jgi:hypothetical protein